MTRIKAWHACTLAALMSCLGGALQAQHGYVTAGYPIFQPPTLPAPQIAPPEGAARPNIAPPQQQQQPAPQNGQRQSSEQKDSQQDNDEDQKEEDEQEKSDKDKDLEARVKALEEAIEKSEKAAKEAEVKAASEPTLNWSARIQTDYWAFPETSPGANFWERGNPDLDVQDRILVRRLRITARGEIFQTMEYKFDVDFGSPDEPAFKDAYIGWTELPIFQTIRLGNQKRPYGLDQLNSSINSMFMERPLVIDAFNPNYRRMGVCAYSFSEDLRYNWQYGAFLLEDIQNTGEYLVTDDPGVHHYQMEIAGRFANTIWYDECSDGRGYAHWAISGALAYPDGEAGPRNQGRFSTRPEARTSRRWIDTGQIVGADSYQLIGLEGVINLGPVQWVTEYQHVFVQRDFGGPDLQFGGVYSYVSYFLTGEHVPWDREIGVLDRVHPFENFFLVPTCDGGVGGGWGAWQVLCRYSFGNFSDEEILGGIGSSVTFGLNWWWTSHSRLMFNYIYGRIHDRYDQNISSATGLPGGTIGPTEGDYHIVGVRFMADF